MKLYARCIACILLVGGYNTTYAQQFTDLEWYQYADSIRYLQDREIVKWYPDGSFGVDREINRAEMMKIILEASNTVFTGQWSDCFSDVTDQRYARYICYASSQKMIKWIGDNRFGPDNSVTIAEWLKIAINAFDYGITEWVGEYRYMPYLNLVHNNNIFSKYAIYPDTVMTRGQMAYLTHQLMLAKSWDRIMDSIRQVTSSGCGQTPPSSPLTELNLYGETRHFLTTIGKNYTSDSPAPLVIVFHGRTNSNADIRNYIKLDKTTQGDAIIVYPSGLPKWWPTRNRQNGGDKSNNLRDFALFDEIVNQFSQQYCINKDEIYVIWHSLGAWFTNTLACARGDVIRGMWSVWGSITRNDCAWPVASIIMHHPDDNLASFAWWVAARDRALKQNRCTTNTAPVWPTIGHCIEYECMSDAPVIRCPHTEDDTRWYYYPHTRPKFATPMIWDFWRWLEK